MSKPWLNKAKQALNKLSTAKLRYMLHDKVYGIPAERTLIYAILLKRKNSCHT